MTESIGAWCSLGIVLFMQLDHVGTIGARSPLTVIVVGVRV